MSAYRWWHRCWFSPASARNLGLCRVLFYGCLFLLYGQQDFSGWGEVSLAFWRPLTLFRALPVASPEQLNALQLVWKASLALCCVGLFTRLSSVVAFGAGLYLLGLPHNFGKEHHFDAPIVLILFVLMFARCADAYALDSRRGSHAPALGAEYAWPVRLACVILASVFLSAGLAKLRTSGLEWVTSDNLAAILASAGDHLFNSEPLTPWGPVLARYGWLTRLLAAGTIVVETGYVLALFSRRARLLLVPGMVTLLVGIRLFMGPTFESFLVCHVFWVPWDRLVDHLMVWVRRHLGPPAAAWRRPPARAGGPAITSGSG